MTSDLCHPVCRQPVADQVLSQLSSAERDAAELLSSPDGRRLRVILEEMTSCADDQQQRSWQLHTDEPAIIEYLQELSTILVSRGGHTSSAQYWSVSVGYR